MDDEIKQAKAKQANIYKPMEINLPLGFPTQPEVHDWLIEPGQNFTLNLSLNLEEQPFHGFIVVVEHHGDHCRIYLQTKDPRTLP